MKKKSWMKKAIVVVLTVVVLCGIMVMTTSAADGWNPDRRYYVGGRQLTNEFYRIGGITYYFDHNGRYVTGKQLLGGIWYYFDEYGALEHTGYSLGYGGYLYPYGWNNASYLNPYGWNNAGWYWDGNTWRHVDDDYISWYDRDRYWYDRNYDWYDRDYYWYNNLSSSWNFPEHLVGSGSVAIVEPVPQATAPAPAIKGNMSMGGGE